MAQTMPDETPRHPDDVKFGGATVVCPECEGVTIVLTNEVYEFIEGVAGLEAVLQMPGQLRDSKSTEDGKRLAVADASGTYTCPHCETLMRLPALPPLEH